MKKKTKKKNKTLKKNEKKKVGIRSHIRRRDLISGLIGFLLIDVLVSISYKGAEESLNINPIEVVNFFSAQFFYLLGFPKFVTTVLGVIVILIPPFAFYFLSKEFFRKN